MKDNVYQKFVTAKKEVEEAIKRLSVNCEYYDVFNATSKLGYYVSTVDSYLMTDKIELDEYNELFSWYSQKSSEVLRLTLALDTKLYEERRKHATDK